MRKLTNSEEEFDGKHGGEKNEDESGKDLQNDPACVEHDER